MPCFYKFFTKLYPSVYFLQLKPELCIRKGRIKSLYFYPCHSFDLRFNRTVLKNQLVSIVINNFNYASFLKEAIQSALAQTYSSLEVLVVDDGSTDHSKEIITSFGEKIIPIFKQNGGQASCYHHGFIQSKGDFILFLDADDYLYPHCIKQVIAVWKEDIAKIQFRLDIVNANGNKTGRIIPRVLNQGNIEELLKKFGYYGTPPGSGCFYPRYILEKIFPFPEQEWKQNADTVPTMLAPLYGQVASIEEPLGAHRVHHQTPGQAAYQSAAFAGLNSKNDSRWLEHQIQNEKKRLSFLRNQIEKKELSLITPIYPQAPMPLRYLLAYHCLHGKPSFPPFSKRQTGFKGIWASLTFPGYCLWERIGLVLWFSFLFLAPGILIKKLALKKYGISPSGDPTLNS